MQKVFSTRLDEAVLDEMERVTRRLRITKRRFLEEAIHRQAMQLSAEAGSDVWTETLGAWRRNEKPATTIRRAREVFRAGFERQHRGQDARLRR
ncbi:MAG TPA: hypothetical protein VJU18_09065 [Vicinamibacteria bacterium]|nr:hypothetical protein [Vicinamibacteria bacterium]